MTALTCFGKKEKQGGRLQVLYSDTHRKLATLARERIPGNVRVPVQYRVEDELVDSSNRKVAKVMGLLLNEEGCLQIDGEWFAE